MLLQLRWLNPKEVFRNLHWNWKQLKEEERL